MGSDSRDRQRHTRTHTSAMAPTSFPFTTRLARKNEHSQLCPVVPVPHHSTGLKARTKGFFRNRATPDVFFLRPQTHTCSTLLLKLAHTPCAQGKKIKAVRKVSSQLWHPALNHVGSVDFRLFL